MKLLFFSDVHLERGPFEPDPKALDEADVIVAAGDIGVGTQGVEWLKTLAKPCVYVPGNHEFWSEERTDYVEILGRIRTAAAGSNVHVLERGRLVIGNLRILGATLWTDYASWDTKYVEAALGRMRDYQLIGAQSWYTPRNQGKLERLLGVHYARRFASQGTFNPVIAYELHKKTVGWLERELARPWGGETVVVTHHAPTTLSLTRSGISDWTVPRGGMLRGDSKLGPVYRAAYASDLRALTNAEGITVWIHGHLHARLDFAVRGVRVCCNARGPHSPAITEKQREAYRWMGVHLSDTRMAEDQADFEKRPWRGENPDFEPGAIVELEDGVMPALMRDALPLVQDMRTELSEAQMFADQMGAKHPAVRLALQEAFDARIDKIRTSALGFLRAVDESLSSRLLLSSSDDLRVLAHEYCGPHRYMHLVLTLRKGTSMRERAALVVADWETLLDSIAVLPEYLVRKRHEMLLVIQAVRNALSTAGIDAIIESPALDGPLRRVPTDAGTVRVQSGSTNEDAVFRIVDQAANPEGPPRRWIFEVEFNNSEQSST